MDKEILIRSVMDCAHAVHRVLKPGLLELLYKQALVIELQEHGIACDVEKEIPALYKGKSIGTLWADIVVDGQLILELKAIPELTDINRCQLVTYLTLTGIDDGLLINFGSPILQIERKWRIYTKTEGRREGHKYKKT